MIGTAWWRGGAHLSFNFQLIRGVVHGLVGQNANTARLAAMGEFHESSDVPFQNSTWS
jgi:hypothetical protein